MTPTIETLRKTHFPHLDTSSTTYLDTTGALPIPLPLISLHTKFLQTPLGNPHSPSPPSKQATHHVQKARHEILRFFNASPSTHVAILTANATGAAKIIAESFPFRHGALVLSVDNHNSILGLREYARRAHAKIRYVPLDKDLRLTHPAPVLRNLSAKRGAKLFAYPAQSNFSGVIHPLKYVQTAHEAGFHVFLDAAAYAPSSKLDLSVVKADFVCVSFYKMFGYPTGIGCLIARRDALGILRRPWFSGGSVAYASVHADAHALHADEAGFEDGTVNFLAASAVTNGLVMLERIGMDAVSRHVRLLGGMLLGCLERFGESVCVYGGGGMDARGGNFAFDVMYKGKRVDARVVEREASERGIALRTGCFCNPGAGEVALGLVGDVKICVGKGREVGEVKRCMGGWVGCVRVSVGIANVERDVEVFEDFLEGFCRRFDESMTVREGKIAEVGGVGRLVATWRKVGGGGW